MGQVVEADVGGVELQLNGANGAVAAVADDLGATGLFRRVIGKQPATNPYQQPAKKQVMPGSLAACQHQGSAPPIQLRAVGLGVAGPPGGGRIAKGGRNRARPSPVDWYISM